MITTHLKHSSGADALQGGVLPDRRVLNSSAMSYHSHAEQAERAGPEEGRPFEMSFDNARGLWPRCGRSIYRGRPGVDEKQVCLMHSRDPEKSDREFQKAFEGMLAAPEAAWRTVARERGGCAPPLTV